MYWLIKFEAEREMCDAMRKVVHRLLEVTAKFEVGDSGSTD